MRSGIVQTPARDVIAGRVPAGAARVATAAGPAWAAARLAPAGGRPAGRPDGPFGRESDGGGDPDRRRLLGRWERNRVVGQRQGGGWPIGSGATTGGGE